MTLFEAKFSDFNISDITQKSINKDGVGKITLINVKLDDKENWMELLFEVKSSVNNPKHVDMKGKFRNGLKFGYSCILRFINLKPETVELLKQGKDVDKVIKKADVLVHCDDPSFYYQAAHEEDSGSHNARYQFQGTKGTGVWSTRHQAGGRKNGLGLCKHLYGCRHWLEDSSNILRVSAKLKDLKLPLAVKEEPVAKEEPKKEEPAVKEEPAKETPKEETEELKKRQGGNRAARRSGNAFDPETKTFHESVLYKLYKSSK